MKRHTEKVRMSTSVVAIVTITGCLLMAGVVFRGAALRQRQTLLAEDIQRLGRIFERIHEECSIMGFEHQKNYVDFLNVEKFVGSEIGAMNVRHPERWQGPYLLDNPTIREKLYQIVRTNKGYFLAPGDGVKLANGKLIGTDIILDEDADIEAMMYDPQLLMDSGKALAWKIPTGDDVAEVIPESATTLVSLRRLFTSD